MKPLLLFTLLLPTMLYAQKMEVSLSMGAALFSNATSEIPKYPTIFNPAIISDFTIGYNPDSHYTIAFRMLGNSVKSDYYYHDYRSVTYADQMIDYILMAKRKIKYSYGDIYGGICLGYASYKNLDTQYWHKLYPTSQYVSSGGGGYIAGLNLGVNFRVSKHVDINVEGSAEYFNIKARNKYGFTPTFNYSYFMYPVTIGVKYKFAFGKKDRPGSGRQTKNRKPKNPNRSPFNDE